MIQSNVRSYGNFFIQFAIKDKYHNLTDASSGNAKVSMYSKLVIEAKTSSVDLEIAYAKGKRHFFNGSVDQSKKRDRKKSLSTLFFTASDAICLPLNR